MKQTLNRAELRCRNAQRIRVELDWSILGMAVAELFASKEPLEHRAAKAAAKGKAKEYRPEQRSLAATMRALRWGMRNVEKEPVP